MRTLLFCAACTLAFAAAGNASAGAQAQSQSSAASAQAPSQQPKPSQPPKKVWTNDDLVALREHGGVSVVGNSGEASGGTNVSAPGTTGNPPAVPKEKDPVWYKKQLAPLYAKLDSLDGQIATVQTALSGDTRGSNSVNMSTFGMLATPQDQLKQLQQQQQAVQNQIDALLDMARHNGIDPGDLR
ncbi:MAG: hypothetical protein ACLP1Y_00135 [Candidatus Acidiferrales bacterium]